MDSLPRKGTRLILRNGDRAIFRGRVHDTCVWIEYPPARGMLMKDASILDDAVEDASELRRPRSAYYR